MPVLLVFVVFALAYFWVVRSREIFVLRLREGRLSVARGRIPSGLLSSFRESIGSARRGTIRASRTPMGARLSVRGDLDERAEQRLRNILGLYPMAKLSAQAIDKRQVASDAFRLHWLLSFLRRR